ncbi:MAG: ParB/RepB/Spo0J family partition protein [Patescibacteria group bacterium]|nr:ParB/RepB/Spo0J family partition protein [Patescibacteria group bacterium]
MKSKTVVTSHSLGLIENIDIYKIKTSEISVREDLGDIVPLALSIKEKGLLQPIIVRIIKEEFKVVAGNRRLAACKKIGWKKIPCHLVDLTDEESFEVALMENIHRKTMNAIEEANAYGRYVKDYGWGGVSDLAKRIGKSQEYVSKRLKLLDLPKSIQEEIIRRRIKPSLAEELSFVKNEKEQSQLAKIIAQRHVTIKKFRESLKNKNVMQTQEEDFISSLPKETRNEDRIFDKTVITLKLTVRRINELMNMVEGNFIIYEYLLQHQKTINEQINHILKSKKKYSKLFY